MTQLNETQKWFDAVVDLLIANGNKLVDEKRWSWDKEGGHCLLTRPIDFKLIKENFEVPPDITLDEGYQRISTLNEYLDIGQRRPWQTVFVIPPFEIPTWRPLLLQKGKNQSAFPVAEIENELKNLGAQSVGEKLETKDYVEPYKTNCRFHTWMLTLDTGRSIGVFIQGSYAGITTYQTGKSDDDIKELIMFLKPLVKKLGLHIRNDQDLVDVTID
tara:strand:- start:29599 stop:30246 length:648 start_codon:yes stop_codon:yes gene_type:complete